MRGATGSPRNGSNVSVIFCQLSACFGSSIFTPERTESLPGNVTLQQFAKRNEKLHDLAGIPKMNDAGVVDVLRMPPNAGGLERFHFDLACTKPLPESSEHRQSHCRKGAVQLLGVHDLDRTQKRVRALDAERKHYLARRPRHERAVWPPVGTCFLRGAKDGENACQQDRVHGFARTDQQAFQAKGQFRRVESTVEKKGIKKQWS